ncbi:MAG: gliding motility-associated C-terminal domain-containing protein [Saprospiraceae bacterium]|nr:gliding motility-associated C-terminal domain-containing protein [Saprospiraceae bacterium]
MLQLRFATGILALIYSLQVIAQCPEITNTTTVPNCIPESTRCGGDQITINVQGGDLPHNGKIDYYADINAGFDPYLGQGVKIGSANITTSNPKCRICPSLLGFMIDACGTEAPNEFLIMWSGSGLNTSDFNFDYAPQNNTGGAGNADIGPGGCGIGAGPSGLVGGCSAISVGANFNIPANSIWIVFTSSNASTSYDFSAVCGLSCKIYVSASTCTRTIGAFSNFDASPGSRTQVMTITGCGCSTNASYDIPGMLTGNGDFWAEGSISNNGCAVPSLSTPAYTAATSVISPFMYTIPQSWCEKDYEIVGIPNPAPDPDCCMNIYTERILIRVKCPIANTSIIEACETNSGQAVFTLEDADADVLGSSNGTVEYFRDMAGTQRIFSPYTSGNATIYARISDGNCKSNIVAIQLKVNLLPVAKATSDKQCDDGSGFASFDLSNLENTIKNGNNGASVKFFEDINKTNEINSPYNTNSTIIYACIHDGKCESKPVAIQLTVLPKPVATTVSASACPGANGLAVFLLIDLIPKITNNPSGYAVNFYEEDLLLKKINPPYTTAGDTIYATVSDGTCVSDPVEIILKVTDLNSVLLLSDRACDDGSGTAIFNLFGATRYLQQGDTSIKVSWYRDSLKVDTLISPVNISGIDTIYAFLRKDSCVSKYIPVILESVNRPVAQSCTFEFCSDSLGLVNFPLSTLEDCIRGAQHSGKQILFARDSLMTNVINGTYTGTGDTLYAVILDSPCNSNPTKLVIDILASPYFTKPNDTVVCETYILPILKGSKLSPNAAYYNAFGSRLQAGDSLLISQWIFLTDTLAHCTDLDSFRVDIIHKPNAGIDWSISICEGNVFNLNSALSGHDAGGYFEDLDFSGSLQDSLFDSNGHNGKTFRFAYIHNGNSYCDSDSSIITIQVVKQLNAGNNASVSICEDEQIQLQNLLINADFGGLFIDPQLTGALSQNQWDSKISGLGSFTIIYQVGDGITCPVDTSALRIDVYPKIEIDQPVDIRKCGYFVLPPITGKNTNGRTAYYALPGGLGKNYQTGDTIFSTSTLYIFGSETGYCTDEDSFKIELLQEINSNYSLSNVCPDYTLQIGTELFDKQRPSGIATLKNASASGCDSIVHVDLSFLPVSESNLSKTYCASKNLMIGNVIFDINNPNGTVNLKNQSSYGCDSFIHVSLSFIPLQIDSSQASICKGDRIQIGKQFYDENKLTGIDTFAASNPDLCDSIVFVNIVLLQNGVFNYSNIICENDSVLIGNVYFSKIRPGLQDTIPSGAANLCDSIVNIQLTFYPVNRQILNDTLCENEFLLINSKRYDNNNPSGIEIFSKASQFGCDSLLEIQLSFLNAVRSQYTPMVCENDSLFIHGKYYFKNKSQGLDTLFAQATGGCDSIVTINLQLLPLRQQLVDTSICENESIIINGNRYDKNNSSGIEILSGASVHGCDSLLQVNVTLLPLSRNMIRDTLCQEEEILIHGVRYNKNNPSGSSIVTSSFGCDSIIDVDLQFSQLMVQYPVEVAISQGASHNLQLVPNFNPSTINWSPTAGLSCVDCLNPVITPNSDQDYTVTLTDENGCIITIHIRVRLFADDQVFVPNAFSPNGDNINDVFRIISENKLTNVRSFFIFDRWGNQIYSEGNKSIGDLKGWDGNSLNGDKMNPGVYIFAIELEFPGNQIRKLYGDISLIR